MNELERKLKRIEEKLFSKLKAVIVLHASNTDLYNVEGKQLSKSQFSMWLASLPANMKVTIVSGWDLGRVPPHDTIKEPIDFNTLTENEQNVLLKAEEILSQHEKKMSP